ncbi:hypothetical protein SAMN05216192_15739 [Paenibacillus typhae]|uniref:Uncharacterized protein n=1 Tax=Paenibacillus typhae TaxID=1174501 RepID=A0A1G9F9Y7_9BACL|nr:hypothetical protein SAMN05216192_15739 [Paenibacillus typhae]
MMVAPSTLVIVPFRMLVTVPAEDNVPAVMVAPRMLEIVPFRMTVVRFPLGSVVSGRSFKVDGSRPKISVRRLSGLD